MMTLQILLLIVHLSLRARFSLWCDQDSLKNTRNSISIILFNHLRICFTFFNILEWIFIFFINKCHSFALKTNTGRVPGLATPIANTFEGSNIRILVFLLAICFCFLLYYSFLIVFLYFFAFICGCLMGNLLSKVGSSTCGCSPCCFFLSILGTNLIQLLHYLSKSNSISQRITSFTFSLMSIQSPPVNQLDDAHCPPSWFLLLISEILQHNPLSFLSLVDNFDIACTTFVHNWEEKISSSSISSSCSKNEWTSSFVFHGLL